MVVLKMTTPPTAHSGIGAAVSRKSVDRRNYGRGLMF